jgi:D-sedoheptulose 7-phosphate isomerase|tara:strand:+ start:7886 stop:8470 length:585 start_codon:yes stop_codon:yes gene_type:complete
MSGLENKILNRAKLLETNASLIEAKIKDISKLVSSVIKNNGKLMFCGNGGSAAECQHMSAEYCATLDHKRPRPGIASISLTTDSSFLTAWTNDFGYEDIFSRQVETLGKKGDLLFCYSTSGNSKNVINAAKIAKRNEILVIGFTGNHRVTKLEKYCDEVFKSPSKETPIIQEFHSLAGHEICSEVEKKLFFKTK